MSDQEGKSSTQADTGAVEHPRGEKRNVDETEEVNRTKDMHGMFCFLYYRSTQVYLKLVKVLLYVICQNWLQLFQYFLVKPSDLNVFNELTQKMSSVRVIQVLLITHNLLNTHHDMAGVSK